MAPAIILRRLLEHIRKSILADLGRALRFRSQRLPLVDLFYTAVYGTQTYEDFSP